MNNRMRKKYLMVLSFVQLKAHFIFSVCLVFKLRSLRPTLPKSHMNSQMAFDRSEEILAENANETHSSNDFLFLTPKCMSHF